MRLLALLVTALAVAGSAAAQVAELHVRFPGFDREVVPPDGVAHAEAVAEGPCTLLARGGELSFSIATAPSWALVVTSPSVVRLDPLQCNGGFTVATRVSATVTRDAPAETNSAVVVRARIAGESAETAGLVRAGYFPLVDAQVPGELVRVQPGRTVPVPLTLTNLGNGATLVTILSAGSGPPTLHASAPAPILLQSRASGSDAGTQATGEILLSAPPGIGWISREEVARFVALVRYAGDDASATDSFTFEVPVLTQGIAWETTLLALSPFVLVPLGLALAGATARLAWRRR